MKSNLRLLLGISLLFGVATGIYEYIFPLFLREQKISFETIGVIYGLAGFAMVLARIYMGGLADSWGRKPLYGWALAICGSATLLTPYFPALLWQALLKTLREIAALTRETVYPVILYEHGEAGFLNRIGKFRGIEFLLQAGGTLLVLLVINRMGGGIGTYRLLFLIAGLALCFGTFWWVAAFHEAPRLQTQRIITVRELFSFDLHPNLKLILIASVIFTFGVQLSHSFYMQLFFRERFGASEQVTLLIMIIHRLTIALPMLLVGNLPIKNLRVWYIGGVIIQGITVMVSAVIPVLGWSAAIFLMHDLIGAGIWSPIQATLTQRYSRDETRGMEVGKVLAWGSVGSIFGPIASGIFAGQNIILPFLTSGIMMILAAIPLFWLNTNAPAPVSKVSTVTV